MAVSKDTPGIKFDGDKLRFDLIPPDAIEEVARVLTYGANKYSDWNWAKGMKYSRIFGAIMRHMWSWWKGENIDPESGISHLGHAACGVFFLIHYEKNVHIHGGVDPYDNRGDAHLVAINEARRMLGDKQPVQTGVYAISQVQTDDKNRWFSMEDPVC